MYTLLDFVWIYGIRWFYMLYYLKFCKVLVTISKNSFFSLHCIWLILRCLKHNTCLKIIEAYKICFKIFYYKMGNIYGKFVNFCLFASYKQFRLVYKYFLVFCSKFFKLFFPCLKWNVLTFVWIFFKSELSNNKGLRP